MIASSLWVAVNRSFPPPGLGEIDDEDVFGTFEDKSAYSSERLESSGGKDEFKLKGDELEAEVGLRY